MISFKSLKAGFELKDPAFFRSWLKNVLKAEGDYRTGEIQYIFCDDNYLTEINIQYLEHDSLTDIITFPNSKNNSVISGDIYISIDRIIENYKYYSTTLHKELSRVIVHGLLHLLGYNDANEDEKALMREKEDYYLHLQPRKIS